MKPTLNLHAKTLPTAKPNKIGVACVASPLKWHGGKNYLAERIVKLMPPHIHYVEPFAGGLSVLLAKDPGGVSEVVNDLNGKLTNFWKVLQREDTFAWFQRHVEAVPFSEQEWSRAQHEFTLEDTDVKQAVRFFIACRQSLAGRMKGFASLSRIRTRRGMNEQVSAWLTCIEGLPTVHSRLKRVAIVGPMRAVDVIKKQDSPQTLFYLDPPYLHETRASTGEYEYEMTDTQHFDLLKVLAHIKGKFMLSGYRSPMYDGDAQRFGWTRHDFEMPNNAAGGKGKRRMVESLWCNFY